MSTKRVFEVVPDKLNIQ